ncbi:MAG: VWA domain-containing protein [Armatimonadota bacterium]
MSFIRFSHPQYLLLLPLVWAYTWWVLRGSLAELGRTRGRLAAALRGVLLTLVVLALAGIQLVRPTTNLCTVFVVDVSDSISSAQRAAALQYIRTAVKTKRPGDSAALVTFGGEALLDRDTDDAGALKNLRGIYSIPGTSRTDIAAGIQLAMASFPPEAGKQVILFTDGNENLGNALEQSELASSNDVRISVVPLARDTSGGEALLLRVEAPTQVRQGAPFQVNVLAESLAETDGVITLYRNNQPVEKRAVHLKPGKTVIAFEQTAPQSGLGHYRAILDVPAGRDTVPDNNVAYAYTRASGKPAVLVVEGTAGDGHELAQTLRSRDIEVALGGPERIPASLAECARYDSLIFANVPAWRMTAAQMTIIHSAVRDTGMGFAMVGGEESFGAGGYYSTPVEQALPVSMDIRKRKQLPSVSLVIVIDISGSMGEAENGVPKIKLAADAAKNAVSLLQPIDTVCVIGYDSPGAFHYVVPKQTPVKDKQAIYSQIDRLAPGGGGIYGLAALQEARSALQGANSQVKHVIFFADAADVDKEKPTDPASIVSLARQMRDREKTTISAIGLGRTVDQDWPLLHNMAMSGGGQSYLVERMSQLPQIFLRDVMYMSRSLLIEKPFQVTAEATHPATRGIPWEGSPPLLGYVCTSMKETPLARQLLTSHEDDPILAAWTHGLGRSLAFTSDATAHWGAYWLGWEGYAPFWSQSLRWTLRQGAAGNVQTQITEEDGRAKIAVDAVTQDGEFRNMLDLRAHVSHVDPAGAGGPAATRETVQLEQTAPGHYEGSFDARATGTFVVTVEERGRDGAASKQMATLVIPYSPEYQALQPNHALLAKITEGTNGATNPAPAEVFGTLRFGSRSLRDLWPLLAVLAAVLFLVDVAVRRVLLPWDEVVAMIRDGVAARLPKWRRRAGEPSARTHTPGLDTLLRRKEAVRQPREVPEVVRTIPTLREQEITPPPETAVVPEPAPPSDAPAPPAAGTVSSLLQKKRERRK